MVQRLEVPGHVLQHFWDLANVEAEVRRRSAVDLVSELATAQSNHAEGGGASATARDDATSELGPSLRACSPVVVYALKRLARGLGSGRSGARQGFALALTAAFSEIPIASLDDGLQLLKSSLEPITQSTKGSEARDILMGQLFGVAALVRAMRARLATGTMTAEDAEAFGAVVAEETSALATSKAYLAESAAAVILELSHALGEGDENANNDNAKSNASMTRVIEASSALTKWLTTPIADAGPETILLALELWPALPPSVRANCAALPRGVDPVAVGGSGDGKKGGKKGGKGGGKEKESASHVAAVFDREHLSAVRDALMEASYTHPQMHSVWAWFLSRVASVPGGLEATWDVLVEDGLLVSGSHQRRYLGFRLFASMLPLASAQSVPALFSPGFTRCLLNNLAKPDNYLHAAAADCLDQIVAFAKSADTKQDVKLSVIAALQRLGPNRFDKISKKNAVRELIQSLSVDDASGYMRELMGIFVASPSSDDDASAMAGGGTDQPGGHLLGSKRRLWALEQAAGLFLRLPRAAQRELVEFLTLHAHYRANASDAKPASKSKKSKSAAKKGGGGSLVEDVGVAPLGAPEDGLREACATRLAALLASNLKAQRAASARKESDDDANKNGKKEKGGKKGGEKKKDDDAKAAADPKPDPKEPPADLLLVAADICRKLDADDAVSLVDDMPEDCAAVRASLFAALDKTTQASANASATAVAPLLRVLAVLQLGDWREFTPSIEDLPRCVDDLISPPKPSAKKKAAKKSKKTADAEDDVEADEPPNPMDVLVDVLLSLLAQPSALLRDVVEHSFKSLSPSVTGAGVGDMLRVVLAPDADNRNAAGGDDSDSEDGAPLAEEDDEDDDSEEEEEVGGGDSDDDSDDDSEDDDAPMDKAKADAIAAALARSGAAADSGSDDSDSDDDAMDDDAMFRIDKLLGQAFKSRREDITRKKSLVRATRDFKFRVLALLELYARAQPGSQWLPGTALPLLGAMQTALAAGTPQASALAERIGGVLTKHVCHARDLPNDAGTEPITVKSLSASLNAAVRAAAKPSGGGAEGSKGFAKPATAVAMYLLRVLEATSRKESGADAAADVACAEAVEAYGDALEMFKSNKNCRLKTPFFQAAFERHPALAAELLPAVAGLLTAGGDKASSRAEYLRAEGAKLLNVVLSLGKKRSPAVCKSAAKHKKVIAAAIVAAIAAPCRNRGARADVAKTLTQCCEAFARASSDAPLSTLMDPNAVVDAVAAQFSVPGMPQKGVNALTRACTLVGKTAPEAMPAEEPAAGGGGGEKKRDRAEGNKGGAKGGKKDAKKEKGDKKRKGESGGDKVSKKKHKKK
ncbi:uncharacterized protein MICPUCDRAFT_56167 [Micromonas pusilla CCMP1545]|uniref:Predicted protein n=1 Tax=Micromonas pusilla (strain CCMP1545) TaxID=564608 RepID=C1MP70_MICPC|nr:uncharacterized protein MICPUCDRAFT_56167 [Micromonas pusilla CCMP1545]EEH58414.1 predicted protein [Micromonas pusilla CCMP1545]|eukprot:XP_003056769.1 predicted protein [Micromonas pusilla CCMP1545]